jgi:hypothetical protein
VVTTVSANLDNAGRLRVVSEGHIANVKLEPDIGPAGAQVLRFLNQRTEKQPIVSMTLERYLLLAQGVPRGYPPRRWSLRSTHGELNLVAQVSRQEVSL